MERKIPLILQDLSCDLRDEGVLPQIERSSGVLCLNGLGRTLQPGNTANKIKKSLSVKEIRVTAAYLMSL